jgi:hypothetical protein
VQYLVVDQNVMRKQVLETSVQNDPQTSFIITDTALVEFVKHPRWEHTMRGSLAILAQAPERTFVSLSIGEVLHKERATFQPIDRTALLNDDFAQQVREIMTALISPSSSAALDDIRQNIDAWREDLLKTEADGAAEKMKLQTLLGQLETACGPQMTKDMRAGRMSSQARLELIRDRGTKIFMNHCAVPPEGAAAFAAKKPMTLRHVYMQLHQAMWWASNGGLASAPPGAISNQRLDAEYALIASFFDGMLTEDRGAKCAYDSLVEILRMT